MINLINASNFQRVESVELNGFTLESYYNNNYFVDGNGQVIYEHCNDDNYFEYWQIHSVNNINEYGRPNCEETYLGAVFSEVGIFDNGYSGERDANGMIMVDTNCN